MKDITDYIIHFLLGDTVTSDLKAAIGYTNDRTKYEQYRVVIYQSCFFDTNYYGTSLSIPELPLNCIENTPLLYGEAKKEWNNNTLIVYSDIIASTYFLISRYEEMVVRNKRDEHGRFPGKSSLPYRGGFIDRPIVDEYGKLLRNWLSEAGIEVPAKKPGISRLYLTHDVDSPFLYRSWKGCIRSLLDKRGIKKTLQGYWGKCGDDPYYTFDWLFEQTENVRKSGVSFPCHSIIFLRSGGRTVKDKPFYKLKDRDIRSLINQSISNDIEIGLHSSYEASIKPWLIKKEKQHLAKFLPMKVIYNRHHFLASREPEDMEYLIEAGITDDFTMGYADVAGFRLGTSRPVRWINPLSRKLTPLTLHPLLIMEVTLELKKYMGLYPEEAFDYCIRLINHTYNSGGEVVLLWHNHAVVQTGNNSYLKELYVHILQELSNYEDIDNNRSPATIYKSSNSKPCHPKA